MSLCKFKDIFGKPGQGIHRHRFLGIAIMDLIMTIILANLIFDKQWIIGTILLWAIGIVCHQIFCVKTPVNTFLFGN